MKIMSNLKRFLPLHLLLLLYAVGAVASKYASNYKPFSLPFFICFAVLMFALFIYALGWQQVLKSMSLTTAYANRGVVLVWGMVFGAIIFGEQIELNMIIGSIVVLIGILFVVSDHE